MKITSINHSLNFKKIYDYSGNYNQEEDRIAKDIRAKMSQKNPIPIYAKRPDLLLSTDDTRNRIVVKSGRVVGGGWDEFYEITVGKYDKSHPFDPNDIKKSWKKRRLIQALWTAIFVAMATLPFYYSKIKKQDNIQKKASTELYQSIKKQCTDSINAIK